MKIVLLWPAKFCGGFGIFLSCSRLAISAWSSRCLLPDDFVSSTWCMAPASRFAKPLVKSISFFFLENQIVIRSTSGVHLHSHLQVALHPTTQLSARLQLTPSSLHTPPGHWVTSSPSVSQHLALAYFVWRIHRYTFLHSTPPSLSAFGFCPASSSVTSPVQHWHELNSELKTHS